MVSVDGGGEVPLLPLLEQGAGTEGERLTLADKGGCQGAVGVLESHNEGRHAVRLEKAGWPDPGWELGDLQLPKGRVVGDDLLQA